MRKNAIFVLLLLTVACGGGGGGGGTHPLPAVSSANTGQTTTAIVQVTIPQPQAGTAASARSPQYVAPQTAFFYVDLQNNTNPEFDNTFTVSPSTCPAQGGVETCIFNATIPAGDPTTQRWSIAMGATTGPPLSVIHDVQPCVDYACPAGQELYIRATPNAVVANVSGTDVCCEPSTLQYDYDSTYPNLIFFTFDPLDAFQNVVDGQWSFNAPADVSGFASPLSIAVTNASGGQIQLQPLVVEGSEGPQLDGTPQSAITFSNPQDPNCDANDEFCYGLEGSHGGVVALAIDVSSSLPGPWTSSITYNAPAITLQPSEFPQLQSAWSAPAASGTLMTITCQPPSSVPAGTNPCTQDY